MIGVLTILTALAADPGGPHGSTVVIPRDLYLALRAEHEEPPAEPPDPWVARRALTIDVGPEELSLDGSWSVEVPRPGWIELPLVGPEWRVERVTVDGKPQPLRVVNGTTVLVARLERDAVVRVAATLAGNSRVGVPFQLLAAPVGTVTVRSKDAVVKLVNGEQAVARVGDRFWTGERSLVLTTSQSAPEARTGEQVVGRVGLGVTVGDADVRLSARLQYRIAKGAFDQVVFELDGAARDLEVTGPLVEGVTRSGRQVIVALKRREDVLVELDARWSEPLPDDDVASFAVPTVTPQGTYRVERSMQLARTGDREIVPAMDGWTGVASAELPDVGRGLVEGTPTSAWVGATPRTASLSLLRFQPVSGPATLVDVAAVNAALSRDGRLLYRVHYTVRNDRGDFLRVTLPPGQRLLSARVGGEPARVAREGDVLLVPLLKSVETVQGLLDFPVQLVILGDGEVFDRKEERPVAFPVVDAPVAVSRVELALPQGWSSELEDGERYVVDAFSEGEGITYGFKSGDANIARADSLYQDALQAWMSNDFDEAQSALDTLRDLGASNENIGRLQSNLDVVLNDAKTGESEALARRVKDQARARAVDDDRKQKELEEAADKALDAGDYDRAEAVYQEALQIGQKLEMLEQDESREQSSWNASVSGKLSKAREFKAKNKADNQVYKERTEIDFEGVDVTGDLVEPQGTLALERVTRSPMDVVREEEMRAAEERRKREESEAYRKAEEAAKAAAVRAEAERMAFERAEVERATRESEERPVSEARLAAEAAARRAAEEAARSEAESRRAAQEAVVKQLQEAGVASGFVEINLADEEEGLDAIGLSATGLGASGSGRGGGGIAFGAKKSAPPPSPPMVAQPQPPPPPPPPAQFVAGGLPEPAPEPVVAASDTFDALQVTATDQDVVIPTFGEVVRYQHLILPAGVPAEVVVRAKAKRGTR
ncbi:MAG: hypothetical protein KC656_04305 [Myxococcales bacterium]|nr:hypothetical protein [Myxococcales bacterium]